MQLSDFSGSNTGVSPVVGVILVVVVTVVIGSVIGAFILSPAVSNGNGITPNVGFQFTEAENGKYTITHDGGDDFDAVDVNVSYVAPDGAPEVEVVDEWEDIGGEGIQEPGASATTSVPVKPGSTILVYWSEEGSQSESLIGKFEVPS